MWHMIPSLAPFVQALAPAFTQPSFATHCQLLLGWLMCLGARNTFRNTVGHHTIDRSTIISAASQDSLERRDIGRIAQQFVARLEVIIKARP